MIKDLIEIAVEAGELIRESFGRKLNIEYKTNESNLVTEVDKASEKLITNFIKKKYPSHGILAEEEGSIKSGSEYTWIIDPLDGTTNFAHGLPIFSVSIGVQKNDKTIAGVVYDVMQKVMYSAEHGSGAYADSEKIKVRLNDKLEHAVLVTGFPYNISDNPGNTLEKFSAVTRRARAVRRLGSAAIDFCYVAKGIFDGFWEPHLNPWDICAGILIVEEAGGLVTDFKGKIANAHSKQILATNKLIHEQMLELLKMN